MLLASIDIEALYSSILHEAGIRAVEYYLSGRGTQFYEQNKFITELLRSVLEHNVFLFNERVYHQLMGTAMGSACAPTYANLLLSWWEATVVFTDEREALNDKIVLLLQYTLFYSYGRVIIPHLTVLCQI